jgi:hypothetical protein
MSRSKRKKHKVGNGQSSAAVIRLTPEARLKKKLRAHLTRLGFVKEADGALRLPIGGKDVIRTLHRKQRSDRLDANKTFLATAWKKLSHHFAAGSEVVPDQIKLRLQLIDGETWESDLFRLACMSWSVPVSGGFGRRLRYLVWDDNNKKLAGVIALGDPVFNLSVRDKLIGWTSSDRSLRLVNVLDAYVLGAVPPYAQLLGGKAVSCLIRSREVYDDFADKYGSLKGVISKANKKANLLVVTTSSSMGRSSVYNRLKLDDTTYFRSIGFTQGWGHFHIPDELFSEMRQYLRDVKHSYADRNRFGHGPNWRLRSIRACLDALDFNEATLKHGIKREVFFCELASNATAILKKGKGKPKLQGLQRVDDIARAAVNRWMVPRALRRPEYLSWTRDDMLARIRGDDRDERTTLRMIKSG